MVYKNSFYPVVKNSGFKMEGYYVWCGSVFKENGKYYLFAARWPEETDFPWGYMKCSEIVLATTDSLDEPFEFEKVVISGRGGDYWDGMMAHNPFILKLDNEYVLFYIGTPDGRGETRAIGYATSKSLDGDWIRSEKPIKLPPNANNPALIKNDEGKLLLYYRDGYTKVYVAVADSYDSKFEVIGKDILPDGSIEDMFVYKTADGYEMIAEDADGVYTGVKKGGVIFKSKDGITWDYKNPQAAYGFDIEYDDGSSQILQRRERPMLLEDESGLYLFTTAKIGGEDILTGGQTWNMVQKIKQS